MNREQAKQLLPVIQAFADGVDVQYRLREPEGREWRDTEPLRNPSFEPNLEWRIKPKPAEGWGTICGDDPDTLIGWPSREETERATRNLADGRRVIHWREVEQ